jgi:hypothetical protein
LNKDGWDSNDDAEVAVVVEMIWCFTANSDSSNKFWPLKSYITFYFYMQISLKKLINPVAFPEIFLDCVKNVKTIQIADLDKQRCMQP